MTARLTPILLGAAALCFVLPFFAGVACEERMEVTGIDLVTGGVSTSDSEDGDAIADSEIAELVVRFASPPAALAFGAAIAGMLVGLLRRRVSSATGLIAGGLAFGGLAALYLDSALMLEEGEARAGFWLAFVATAGAVLLGGIAWPLRDKSAGRREVAAIAASAIGLAVLMAEIVVRTLDSTEPPLEEYWFWSALVAVGIPVGVLTGCLLLRRRGAEGLAAGLLLGTGLVALFHAVSMIALIARQEDSVSSMHAIASLVAGASLILVGGVIAALQTAPTTGATTGRLVAVAGAALVVIATAVNFDGGGNDSDAVSVLSGDAWLAMLPLGVASVAALSALLASRLDAQLLASLLLVLGGAASLFYLDLCYPLISRGETTSFAPGALVGVLGGALVVAAGAIGLRDGARTA